jgi:tol-pal system protein YbgF
MPIFSRHEGNGLGLTKAAFPLLFVLAYSASCCYSGTRFHNLLWQLDSLNYYTAKSDSALARQSNEMAQLRIDFYTKSDEISEKLEMLNTRLSETELQITQLSSKLGSKRPAQTDSEDISQINLEARMIYESAYLNYVKGDYNEAISGFKSYLKVAPDSPLSDNALYWIAESHTALGKRQDAVDTFNELLAKYPQSSKRPTVLYKIGIIYEEARDLKTARTYFEKVITEFPNSPEATLAKNRLNP